MSRISSHKIPLLVLAGPTAVGKTAFSIELARKLGGEIVNADSLQFYRGLDIGTGKILAEEMRGVPHHLLDILEPDQAYDVSAFVDQAHQVIQDIDRRHKLAIVVGGSGLYIEALLYHLELGRSGSSNPQLRQELEDELARIGAEAFWQQLQQLDSQAAAKIPIQNHRRMVRAMEVIKTTGKAFSAQIGHQEQLARYNHCLIVLDRPRPELYQRINQRVIGMVKDGLEDEVRQLFLASQGTIWQSMQGIGYKEWLPYFKQEKTLEEVIQDIQLHSRRYAKRQLTWFRNRFRDKYWLEIVDEEQALKLMLEIIQTNLRRGD